MWTIYHNENCSKSRAAVALLEGRGIPFTTIDYLENPPTAEKLKEILSKLDTDIESMVRHNEDEFIAIQEDWNSWTVEEKLQFLADHPKVLQRPIVVADTEARIGRPDHTPIASLFQE